MPIKETLVAVASLWPYAAAAFVVGVVLTRLTVTFANRHALHAIPNHRSSHDTPTPQLGGIAVAAMPLAFLAWGVVQWLLYHRPDHIVEGSRIDALRRLGSCLPLFIGGLLYFVIGVWDDVRALRAAEKFVAQVLATIITFVGLWGLGSNIPGWFLYYNTPYYTPYHLVIGMIWVVCFVNAFNFMDGMNGKAGMFGLNAVAFLLLLFTFNRLGVLPELSLTRAEFAEIGLKGSPEPLFNRNANWTEFSFNMHACWHVLIAGSLLGFLVFNCRPKARIFLGDGGSHFLGFAIAMAALYQSKSLMGPGVSLLVFFILLLPFIYDVALTMVKRIFQGKKFYEAHREHLYQRLMICGMSHMQVLGVCVVTYVLCGVLAVGCAFAATLVGRFFCLLLALVVMGAYTGFVFFKETRSAATEA